MRQLAETLKFAHQRGVSHRSLSPWSIEYVQRNDRAHVVIRDWLSAGASNSTHTQTRFTLHGLASGSVAIEQAAVYLAPEVLSGDDANPRWSDLFSLGAISYAVFSNKHPAANPEELATKCRNGPGLRLSEVVDGAPDKLQELIQYATDLSPSSRPVDFDEFLKLLDEVEDELTTPDPVVGVHPLDAQPGDTLSGGFEVISRLGSGSTCIALAVWREGRTGVLKIAKDASMNHWGLAALLLGPDHDAGRIGVVFLGPNGVRKTMLAQNLAHHAVLRGFTARFTTAPAMLGDLDAQDGALALRRRLQRYVTRRYLKRLGASDCRGHALRQPAPARPSRPLWSGPRCRGCAGLRGGASG